MTTLVSGVVVLLLLWLALWTVVARDAFLAVAGFVVYGLLLSLVWVRLAGIDVALTEAAIGGGLTGALLLGAVGRLRGTEAEVAAERSGAGTRAVCAGVARAGADAGAAGGAEPAGHRRGQPDHRSAAGLSRAGHASRGDRAGDRADRRVVAGS